VTGDFDLAATRPWSADVDPVAMKSATQSANLLVDVPLLPASLGFVGFVEVEAAVSLSTVQSSVS
jgi:hypothetical protein